MPRKRTMSVVAAVAAAGAALTLTGPASAVPPVAAVPAVATAAAEPVAPGIALARERAVVRTRNGEVGPYGPDPRRAFVPDERDVDWGGWRNAEAQPAQPLAAAARALDGARAVLASRSVREAERAGTRGANDTLRRAQKIAVLGTVPRRVRVVAVRGRLSPAPVPAVADVAPAPEPNDAPSEAYDLGVSARRGGAHTTGTIGDHVPDPEDPELEDVDLYKVTLKAGQLLSVDVKRTSGDLLPFTALVDAAGNLVRWGVDDLETSSSLRFAARTAATYYVLIGGYLNDDIASGAETSTRGGYDLTVTARAADRDVYAVTLRAGDVLGAKVSGAAGYVSVFDSRGTEVHGSPFATGDAYPKSSPLPRGGQAAVDHVVARSGTHYVEVTEGDGAYQADLRVERYGGEARRQTQIVYLDTNGQRVDTRIFGGPGIRTLSPLRSFLGTWGLTRRQEAALVGRIKATVQENLDADLRRSGLSRYVSVKVVTSLDGRDPFGRAGVSRVVIGGTIAESGVETIGVAQSIDPGNFERRETALVLLDVLGAPRGQYQASLNNYLTRRSNRVAFVGQAIGNVVSHEVGHFIGNWHTDNGDRFANLMDAGGENPATMFGVGRDGVGGTRDDRDVDFGTGRYQPDEGFTGVENTLARSVFGMSTRR